MARKKITATAELFLNTKNAQNDAAKFVGDLKEKLSSIETAADKLTVFKDLVGYISQVDKALGILKAKNADTFNHMFDGLDSNLRKQLEGLFGVSGSQLGDIDVLREKLATLTPKSGIKEIRNFAKEINSIFSSMGIAEPFNIEEQFFGKANAGHIQLLTDSLDNFATAWKNVNATISNGFGGGGGSGSGSGGPDNAAIQKEISSLEEQINKLEDLQKRFKNVQKIFKSNTIPSEHYFSFSTADEALASVKQLMSEFDRLQKEIESGNTSSVEYYENLLKMSDVVLKLKSAYKNIRADSDIKDVFMHTSSGQGDNMLGLLSRYSVMKSTGFSEQIAGIDISKAIAPAIQNIIDQIEALNASSGKTSAGNDKLSQSYDSLIKKLQEYKKKYEQLAKLDPDSEDADVLFDDLVKLENEIIQLSNVSKNVKKDIKSIFKKIQLEDINLDDGLSNIAKKLGIDANLLNVDTAAETKLDADDNVGGLAQRVEKVGISAEQAEAKVKEFLQLCASVDSKAYYEWTDIDVGKYTEKLDAAKKELDELGASGVITAEKLEEVQRAFDASQARLRDSKHEYTGYGNGIYWSDNSSELSAAQERNAELQEENERLQRELSEKMQSEANASRVNQLLGGYDSSEYYDRENLESILQERNAIIQSLRQEGVITDELLQKHEAINAEIQLRIDSMKALDDAERTLNQIDDLSDSADLYDLDSVTRLLETRKQMLNSISSLAFDADTGWLDENIEEVKGYNNELEQRIELLKQVRQGLISIDDVDDILAETGSLNDKLSHLKDFAYGLGLTEAPGKDDELFEELREFEEIYDRITLKLANGKSINILPDDKGLRALAKFYDSEDGQYGPSEIEDVVFVRKQEQVVIEQNNQSLQEQLSLQKQINAEEKASQDVNSAETAEYKAETKAIEEQNEALVQNTKLKTTQDDAHSNANIEVQQLEQLRLKLVEVEDAIQRKTQAFREEGAVVDQVVAQEIAALKELFTALSYIKAAMDSIRGGFAGGDSRLSLPEANVVDADNYIPNIVENGYALDSTLLTTNSILGQILGAVSNNDSVASFVAPLHDAVAELKNVASGIVTHQKSQRTDLTSASSRIATNYRELSSVASNAVGKLGADVQVKGMKALVDNVVRVEGAVRDASGAWTGFTVDINEANQATIVNTNTQSAFAKELNEVAEAAKKAAAAAKEAKNNKFDNTKKAETDSFEQYYNSVKDADYMTEQLNSKLVEFKQLLGIATTDADLEFLRTQFAGIKKEVDAAKAGFEELNLGHLNNASKKLKSSYFKLTDDQQSSLAQEYQQAMTDLEHYQIAVKDGHAVELKAINETTAALRAKIAAYEAQNKKVVTQSKNQKFGSTAELNATARFKTLSSSANRDEFETSSVIHAKLKELDEAYDKLINKRKQLLTQDSISDEEKEEFKALTKEYNQCANALEKIIKTSDKLRSGGAKSSPLGADFFDNEAGRKEAMMAFVDQIDGVVEGTIRFNDSYNKCMYTVNNGDGTITQMTASFTAARNEIVATSGETKRATTAFGAFINEVKGKFKSLSAYLVATISIYDFIRVIRQGVTYVKEIDTALTELKKVTDETDASYNAFLQDMAKTGSVVGATVKDLTTMASEWARLGSIIKSAPLYSNIY